jgi:predicted nucleotidyltransferase
MTDFAVLLRALAEGKARFIVVGGAAATAHGAARLTADLDIVYERSPENIQKLAMALATLRPYLRGAPPGLPFQFDAETLQQGLNFTLTTSAGDIDLLGEITGGGSYADLAAYAIRLKPFGIECQCLGLHRLIQVKRAAGRAKDWEAIAELEALAEEGGSRTQ